ncbi:MAG: TolC family protein [Pseudomonadota bacterium]|uniref:TolC family protein n=1 Tax=Aquabacterium commune TaxID=70586 RepID=UPI003BB1ABDE
MITQKEAAIHSARRHASAYLVALSIFSGASLCQAADAPPYAALLSQALTQAPELLERRADVSAAAADAAQAGAWLNPRLDAVVENLGAPASGGQSQRQNTYTLTQPLELMGKRGARIEAGERNILVAQSRQRQAQVAFAYELALAYATVEAAQARAGLAKEDLSRATDDVNAAKAQVKAGKEAGLRLAQAQASASATQAARQAAEADVVQALARLSALVGSSEPYTGISESLLTKAQAPAAALAGETPAVATARAEREALEAQARVEQKRWLPEVGLSAGLRRYGWTSESGYVIGISTSIPIFDRNSSAVVAANERIAAAEARLAAASFAAEATRRSAQAQSSAAEQRLIAATEGERAASEAYRLGRIGYDSGKTSLMELLAIRRTLSDAKGLTIEARLARVRALAALAQADGRLAFGD